MVLLVFVNFTHTHYGFWATMATATSFNPIQVKLESLLINNAENHKYNHRRKCKPIKEIIPPRILL